MRNNPWGTVILGIVVLRILLLGMIGYIGVIKPQAQSVPSVLSDPIGAIGTQPVCGMTGIASKRRHGSDAFNQFVARRAMPPSANSIPGCIGTTTPMRPQCAPRAIILGG